MKKIDVFTFGETMVLFQPEQMLPLEYIHQFPKKIGGAESNVAIGLTRLGHSASWYSKLGNDPFGRFILNSIRGEGVDTSSCQFTDQAPTGLIFKEQLSSSDMNVYYYRKGSSASLMEPEDLDEKIIAQAKIIHISGITPALSESCRRTVMRSIEIAKQNGTIVIFDPNMRMKLWSEERAKKIFNEIAEHADIILPGLDEGQLMTGKKEVEAVAEALLGKSNKTIIIKLGSQGAYLHSNAEKLYVDGFPVEKIVDPVGAGDGFAAGIISGILRQEPMKQVVRRANAIGAMVVGVSGDIEGLPYFEAVEKFMKPAGIDRDVKR
ncbi:2-dehydro-3-deoxygluconate kinase [Planococcus halocryophilus Or1]|uniref:2-dehydro-3-deoxygluconokinase n=1 Tax=Planococcus halocryophilus TaxID=1215089 RepID=A0A1C7DSE2_9BACL|nr:sugar kinase [Planococcus halocryophilus]ANU14570.1 2-dehydro-3-deoxygluconokinase [Planococcus halocryophilus]EMF46743.1 2-dehydro-3-deoxygluconate kinase [Planococcus halocryophilus Or1]